MTENKNSTSSSADPIPFGAMERPKRKRSRRPRAAAAESKEPKAARGESDGAVAPSAPRPARDESRSRQSSDRQSSDRQSSDRQSSDRQSSDRQSSDRQSSDRQSSEEGQRPPRRRRGRRRKPGGANRTDEGEKASGTESGDTANTGAEGEARNPRGRTRRKRSKRSGQRGPGVEEGQPAEGQTGQRRKRGRQGQGQRQGGGQAQGGQQGSQQGKKRTAEKIETEGMLMIEHAGHGHLRTKDQKWLGSKQDVHVSPRIAQKFALREGSMIKGIAGPGFGRHKSELLDVTEVDGRDPIEAKALPVFKSLRSIDPDYHYAVGTETGDLSLRVLDLICPVGRGQRGLIVAPPRSGKTVLMQKFAKAIEDHYPDVTPMVLLVDERPEEATEWTRAMERAEVYVSTNDEPLKHHVAVCETVWKRCQRLVELGEEVVLILDSITRMARAYNNVYGNSGKTMSGGLDSRAMERPKQFFGAARNTESAGSLTILGTTLIETGSRMDQVIFEEFKGTGNMELVLSRKLSDRRVFPAIDIEKSGTRKEEKLVPRQRLHLTNTLRRVLTKMHFAEAMELLLSRLDDCETNDEFLARFQIDPD
ncbi:MAG: transcription termination factor Rho [Planctomycetota bacterium]